MRNMGLRRAACFHPAPRSDVAPIELENIFADSSATCASLKTVTVFVAYIDVTVCVGVRSQPCIFLVVACGSSRNESRTDLSSLSLKRNLHMSAPVHVQKFAESPLMPNVLLPPHNVRHQNRSNLQLQPLHFRGFQRVVTAVCFDWQRNETTVAIDSMPLSTRVLRPAFRVLIFPHAHRIGIAQVEFTFKSRRPR